MYTDQTNRPTGIAGLWMDEIDRCEFEPDDFWTARCAVLADELDVYRIQAESDPNFEETKYDWDEVILQHCLWLPLEQSCSDGVLLPMDMRALRLQTCPKEILRPMSRFFEFCPAYVKHHLALMYYVVVRMDRARRTGSPEWRPGTALPRDQQSVFFRPPVLTIRKYTG